MGLFGLGVEAFRTGLGLAFAGVLVEITLGVDGFVFLPTLTGDFGGFAFGVRIFAGVLDLGVLVLGVDGNSCAFTTLGVRGILTGVFTADFGVPLGVAIFTGDLAILMGDVLTGLRYGDPGGNSNRKDRSIIVNTSLCPTLLVCLMEPVLRLVGLV